MRLFAHGLALQDTRFSSCPPAPVLPARFSCQLDFGGGVVVQVGSDNVAKIADFGISKFVQGSNQRLQEQVKYY